MYTAKMKAVYVSASNEVTEHNFLYSEETFGALFDTTLQRVMGVLSLFDSEFALPGEERLLSLQLPKSVNDVDSSEDNEKSSFLWDIKTPNGVTQAMEQLLDPYLMRNLLNIVQGTESSFVFSSNVMDFDYLPVVPDDAGEMFASGRTFDILHEEMLHVKKMNSEGLTDSSRGSEKQGRSQVGEVKGA